ncbi:peptidase S8 [Brevibacillus fluminis]|uniref:Peptidase S8 n=1 Tax=Brevibacillus fluminis TaxID=511487 RepID=A0A3M8DNH8_9BACL|nr:S8 family peptidase [Brevibacillus fluminis]RNB89564.1 peptidase S8 [Brevibacillus fluminis]
MALYTTDWIRQHKHLLDLPLRKGLRRASPQTKKENARYPVIVQFKKKTLPSTIQSCKKQWGPSSFIAARRLGIIKAISGTATLSCLQKMCESKHVERIYLNQKAKMSLDVAAPSVGLTKSTTNRFTGKGVTIAILDTGIYPHPDLKGRIIAFRDIIRKRTKPYDDNGHGTHVAGCAAGYGNNSKGKVARRFIGAAPHAKLVGVKVLAKDGQGNFDDIIAGVQWCIRNRKKYGIRVLNLSLGAEPLSHNKNDPLCQAVARAVRVGLVTVVCAGNNGPNRRTIYTPGICPTAITVGATDDRNKLKQTAHKIARFSSRGPSIYGQLKPDLVAPGVNITSLRAPGSFLDRELVRHRVGRWYFTLSGCSMSTPLVAGTVACMLEENTKLTPRQVKSRLLQHTVHLVKTNRYAQGNGELNARFLKKK